MNSKAQTMTLIKLLIAASLIIIFAWLVIKFFSEPETQTLNSFKTLGAEIKLMIKDLDETDKAQITVPVYMEKGKTIRVIDKSSSTLPAECKKQTCLVLLKGTDLNKVTNTIRFGDIRFKDPEDYILSQEGEIIKVKLTGEIINKEKVITLEKEQTSP